MSRCRPTRELVGCALTQLRALKHAYNRRSPPSRSRDYRGMLAGEADLLKSVFLKLTVQGGQANIQRSGGGLAITSAVLQCLHNRLALDLSEGSVTGQGEMIPYCRRKFLFL